jgi:hypothetical protein
MGEGKKTLTQWERECRKPHRKEETIEEGKWQG